MLSGPKWEGLRVAFIFRALPWHGVRLRRARQREGKQGAHVARFGPNICGNVKKVFPSRSAARAAPREPPNRRHFEALFLFILQK